MGRSFYLFDPEQFQDFEKAGSHNDKCPSVVGNATRWVVDIMLVAKKAERSGMWLNGLIRWKECMRPAVSSLFGAKERVRIKAW